MSVVIPTIGRPILVRTLDSLCAMRLFERVEVIVAGLISGNDVSRRVEEFAERHANIRHLPVSFPVGDSSEKKNAGAGAARAPIIAFIDDDVVVSPEWAERMLEAFEDPSVGLASGPSLTPEDVSLMARLAGVALSSPAAGYVSERYVSGHPAPRRVKWSRLIGCNMAYRRSVFEELGGFDPKFWPGEEMIAAFKATQAGHKLLFHPKAWLVHYPRATFFRFVRQIYGYGATRIRLIRARVEIEPATLVPALWVLSLPVLGLGALFFPLFGWLLALELGLYLLVVLWIAVLTAARTRRA